MLPAVRIEPVILLDIDITAVTGNLNVKQANSKSIRL